MQCARIVALALAAGIARPVFAQESALDSLRAAASASPADPAAAVAYARGLRRAGRTAEASAELRRILPLAHGGDAIEVHYEAARVATDRGEHARAMAECRAIAPLSGGAATSHACIADAHLSWRRASEALLETEQALANGNPSYDAKVAEGLAYELELKEDLAEQSLRQAIAWKPDAWLAHMRLGRLLVHRLRHDEGEAELRKALSLDPNGPDENFELALTLPANAEAATLLTKAVHERPTFGAALRRLAEVDLALGRGADARAAAQGALKSDPQDAGSHLVMGRVALSEKKPDDAIAEGKAALKIIANSAPAELLVADAYASKGEIDLAVEAYQAAYGFDHTDPASLVRASQACHAAGRETSAKAFGDKATKEFPDWAPAWVAFGDALAANKELAQARSAYDSALRSRGPLDPAAVQSKIAALK
jgi:tetratricopeptide (TPR) repeat protein